MLCHAVRPTCAESYDGRVISADGLRPPLQGTGLPPEPRLAPPPPPAAARSRMKVSKYCTARACAPHLVKWRVCQV